MIIKIKNTCTKNNNKKDKEYLPPRIMIKKDKKPCTKNNDNNDKNIPCTKINDGKDKKYTLHTAISLLSETLHQDQSPNVVIIMIVPCTSSDQ